MNDDVNMHEQLSALADGQLQDEAFARAMELAGTSDGLATWQIYHLVGDVMRSSELARPADMTFLSELRVKLAAEPLGAELATGALAQVAAHHDAPAMSSANASVFHWKVAAGIASLAAVAAIGWHTYAGLPGGAVGAAPQLAAAPAVNGAPEPALALAEGGTAQSVMIRDPRLDELLAAHKQFGSTSSLQMPAGFLRNATFEAPAR